MEHVQVPEERDVDAQQVDREDLLVPLGGQAASATRVLALQRAVGNRAVCAMLARQTPPSNGTAAPPAPLPRRTIVAIMGADRAGDPNRFYEAALRFWRAHRRGATFVTDQRNLADLLTWLQTNVSTQERIDELVIVSHANEDGTLSFGINAADADNHLSFAELRAAVSGGTLPQLGGRVDAQTHIRIKGCDIGRSLQMVDLVDEAFGGAGVVTAPTHEQGYNWDSQLAAQAQSAQEAQIRTETEAAHAQIPAVPDVPALPRGATRDEIADHRTAVAEHRRAVAERDRLVRARTRAVAADVRARHQEAVDAGELAGTVEEFSGPMFQRPGHQLFTVAELRTEVDRLYGHLSETQRASLATRLAAADRRSVAQQVAQGTFTQHGQRVDRRTEATSFPDPLTVAEAQASSGAIMRESHFTPRSVVRHEQVPGTDGFRVRTVLEGRYAPPGEDAYDGEFTLSAPFDENGAETVVPDDATLIARARARVASPDKYTWSVSQRHAAGVSTRVATGERVISYLHHETLNATPHDHFMAPETDARFFATSTFAPPPPAVPVTP